MIYKKIVYGSEKLPKSFHVVYALVNIRHKLLYFASLQKMLFYFMKNFQKNLSNYTLNTF